MAIRVLDQITINKIAAGEVIERPASVVKELVENAIDARASAVTVEIKDGGTSFIRITDNGQGFQKDDIPVAFLRHSTSKIQNAEDLNSISSLGFRGEALSSIAAVSQIELITKNHESLMGNRYIIEGGKEKSIEAVGCPDGTTFIVRNLFFNTPARKKFLKSPVTEGGYIAELIEKLSLSHPDISFRFISNGQNKLYTSGNGNIKDIIYHIYGRDISSNILPVQYEAEGIVISGFVGKPVVNRGNRNYENYFINGRYIKSNIINRAIEEAYKPYMMQHKYPFTAIHFMVDSRTIDVNVHPTKMELRFSDGQIIYDTVLNSIEKALTHKEFIPDVIFEEQKKYVPQVEKHIPEPFEKNRIETMHKAEPLAEKIIKEDVKYNAPVREDLKIQETTPVEKVNVTAARQVNLFNDKLLDEKSVKSHKIIGQVFDTYWIVQFEDKMYIIDQHAAHEKVLYERIMAKYLAHNIDSQNLVPPIVLTLSSNDIQTLKSNMTYFSELGFSVEPFGGNDYCITAVPLELYGLNEKDIFLEILDELSEGNYRTITSIHDRIATMACKAAVKGNNRLSQDEAKRLIDELLTLENPYNCPHGRPTIISMSKYEMEKKFKRIV